MSTINDSVGNDIVSLRDQLKQLQSQLAAGALSAEVYDEMRTQLERRILDWALNEVPLPSGVEAGSAVPTSSHGMSREPAKRLSWKLMSVLGGTVLLVAAAGYSWVNRSSVQTAHSGGNLGMSGMSVPAIAPGAPASNPHATDFDQIAAMTEKLATRLKTQPQDGQGWAMLARSYGVLGNFPEAVQAYEKAVAIVGENPVLLADYADALALKNKNVLAGEPMKLVERALKSDPLNTKALSLAGTHAFDTKNYKEAVKLWEKVVQIGPATDPVVEQVQISLVEARKLAGLPAAASVTDAASKPSQNVAPLTVSGTVKLSSSLTKNAQPLDTLFVFARLAEGSRMPLAILRKQVKDLPFQFTLDDSTSMSPNARLSTAGKVIVGARISKSGNAIPEAGDLAGQSAPILVGSKDLTIEIREVIKP